MKITTKKELSPVQKKQILTLWNKEYPKAIQYKTIAELDCYLQSLQQLSHRLVTDNNSSIIAWYFEFMREGSKWFGIIIDHKAQGKSIGSQLLDLAKENNTELNGWVIDQNNKQKADGSNYRSPLGFYIKNNFKIISDTRLGHELFSAVKIQWKRNTSKV